MPRLERLLCKEYSRIVQEYPVSDTGPGLAREKEGSELGDFPVDMARLLLNYASNY